MPGISDKIVRNTVFNAIGRFWGILIGVALTPYIVHIIGMERYGIWTLVGATTSYFSLLDLGVGAAFIKYISGFYATKDHENINKVVNTGLLFYSALAVFVILLGWGIVDQLLSFLSIPAQMKYEARCVFILGIILFAVSSALSVFFAIQGSLQRMDVSNKLAIAMSVPSVAGTVFFLEKGFGLSGLMWNNAILLALSSAANIIIAFRLFPELKLGPAFFDRRMLRKLVGFGWNIQVTSLASLFAFQGDKIIISHFLSVGMVSFYQLGRTVIDKTRDVPLLLTSAVIPAASELSVMSDGEKLKQLYLRGEKYLAFAGIPLLAVVFAAAPLIMRAWIGQGYASSVLVIRVMAFAYMINYLTGMATAISSGTGKPQLQMKASLFYLAVNLALTIILVVKFGFTGFVCAMFASLSLSSVYFMTLFYRHFRYPFLALVKEAVLPPLMVSACLGGGVIWLNRIMIGASSGRVYCLTALFLETAAFISLYLLAMSRSGYLDAYDKCLLKEKIPLMGKLI